MAINVKIWLLHSRDGLSIAQNMHRDEALSSFFFLSIIFFLLFEGEAAARLEQSAECKLAGVHFEQ